MKKVLKAVFVLAAVLSLLFVGYVTYKIFEKPDGLYEYSAQNMQDWVRQELDSGNTESLRRYDVGREQFELIQNQMQSYIDSLMENDAECRYEVAGVTFGVKEEAKYLELSLKTEYRGLGEYHELEYIDDDMAAVEYVIGCLDGGVTDITFRTGPGWDSSRLGGIGDAVVYNASDVAAVAKGYSYFVGTEDLSRENFCTLIMEYEVDPSVLDAANGELRAAADSAAAELASWGVSDTRLQYLNAAQYINSHTDYDFTMADAIHTDERSQEEWMQSSGYGSLIMGSTVCTGYAMAFKSVCDRLGLPCWVVSGFTEDTGHAWNMVLIDGETWYMDCTFADTSGEDEWLLMSESQYAQKDYYYADSAVRPW